MDYLGSVLAGSLGSQILAYFLCMLGIYAIIVQMVHIEYNMELFFKLAFVYFNTAGVSCFWTLIL